MKTTNRIAAVLAGVLAFAGVAWGSESTVTVCSGTSAVMTVRSQGSFNVAGHAEIGYPPFKVGSGDEAGIWLDGTVLFSTTGNASFDWQPQTTGNHTIEFRLNGVAVTSKTVKATSLAFAVPKAPNPPTAADGNISITPVTRNFGVGGGGGAIVVSGSGTWTASVSDSWITLNAATGAVGYPVAYTVDASAQVESRTGYVYVSGHVHTVTQDGLGGSISPTSATFESAGGTGTISVAPVDRIAWQARANCDWVSVSPTSGSGAGTVTFRVAPLNESVTRQGTLTVAGQTFTVFQYGRRIKISPKKAEYDYYTHVIPITVDALAITEWTVTPQNSWISIVDGGNGHGGDLVTVAIAENPSWAARTGTVQIGTETFTVTQKGRTALEFAISPATTTASVEGANGLIAVTATPDLPWSAASQANWLTIYSTTASGAGNGNVVYSASPNPTLYNRTGTIKVTPGDTKVSAKTHTVTQPAAVSAISANGYEFEAVGESFTLTVSLSDIVQWQIQNKLSWITVSGSTNRVGPGTVTLQAAPNDTVQPRSGTVTIARKAFKVMQKARGVEVEYDTKLFGTDGGDDSISIHPDGQVSWTAVSSDPTWITIFQNDSGVGDGEILYIVAPYVGNGDSRTGTITVGDKTVWITQRAYELSIDPAGSWVAGNNGAGEFGVSAGIHDVWTAIVTEPWITIVDGYDAGTGSGTVRFLYTDNDTGKTRVGKIIVAGEVYTLQQRARQLVAVTVEAGHGGTVSGGGSYDLGTDATLTAVPDGGYAFSCWTGAVDSMENPLVVRVDVPKTYTAVFEPLPIAFTSAVSGTNGVALAWNYLAWATHYLLFRGTTSVPSSATLLADIPNTGDCTFLDDTGEAGVEYWYWIEAEGVEDDVAGDPATGTKQPIFSPIAYTNLMGASNPNPAEYQEGTLVSFENPGPVTGYTFSGWTPPSLGADATGAQTVRASWTANRYEIAYDPNGGSGTTETTSCTYDAAATLASNGFTCPGWDFAGWGTNAAVGGVVFAEGAGVTNLASADGAVVTLFAQWTVDPAAWTFTVSGGTATVTGGPGEGNIVVPPVLGGCPVTAIGEGAFSGCGGLTGVTLPDSVESVGEDAFAGSGNLAAVRVVELQDGAALLADAGLPEGCEIVPYAAPTIQTATFDAHGGDCTTGSKTYPVGGTYSNLPAAARTGYAFAGWWTAAEDGTEIAAGVAVTTNAVRPLHAHWTANTYAVAFDRQGGTGGTESATAVYGEVLPAVNVPARTGYAFGGYWTEHDGGGTQYYTDTGGSARSWDMDSGATLYANWTANAYAVAIDRQGGTGGSDSEKATYASAMPAIALPTRTGYAFGGYFTEVDGSGTQYYTAEGTSARRWNKTAATTLYAKWTANAYAVALDRAGGTGGSDSTTATYGSAMPAITVPARTGYAFGGYFTETDGRGTQYYTATGESARAWDMDSGATLHAKWTANAYTVTLFHAGGTGGNDSVTAFYGSAMPAIAVPTRTGYTFGGYHTGEDGTGIQYYTAAGGSARAWDRTADASLYAKWTINTYAIALDRQGGTGGNSSVTATYESAMPGIAIPTREGYAFGGYFTEADGSGTQYYTAEGTSARTWNTAGAATLYAKWTANTYTVALDLQGGGGTQPYVTATYDSAMRRVAVPVRTGYAFGGYFTETNGGGTQYYTAEGTSARTWNLAGTATLYAKWTANAYAVALDRAGGTGGSDSVTATYGSDMPAIAVPARTGYAFGGYFSAADGGGTQYYTAEGESARTWNNARAATLYAKWTANTYIVTLDPAGGMGGTESVTATYESAMPEIAIPTREGYAFGGYFTEADGGGTRYYTMEGKSSREWDQGSAATLFAAWFVEPPGWSYTISKEMATVTGGPAEGDIAIPSTLGGCPVTSIGPRAFENCSGLTSVTIPDSVTSIVRSAFENCSGLTSVIIPDSVTSIGAAAFANCTNLKDVTIPDSVTKILRNAFQDCNGLTNVTIPDSVTSIGDSVFSWCRGLTNVVVGNGVTNIGAHAFYSCSNLKSLGVPAAWEGTDILGAAAVPEGCTVMYGEPYTLLFDANGGTGTMADQRIYRGATAKLQDNAFWKHGCTFMGWSTTKTGPVAYANAADVKNLAAAGGTVMLYAQWTTGVAASVYRFYSAKNKGHFFTISEAEKQNLIDTNPNWKYERVAYRAFTNQVSGTVPLYRFYSQKYKGHFYTTSETEKNNVIANNPNWKYERIAYYVHPSKAAGTVPVYRFWSQKYGHHFYTTSESEKQNLIDTNPNWKYERIAFYALPPEAAAAGRAAGGRTPPAPAGTGKRIFSVDDCGVFPLGAHVVEISPDEPTVAELGDREEAEELASPLAVTFRVPEEGAAWQLWSAERGILAEDAVSSATVALELPDLGLWHWLRFFDEDGGSLSSTWLFPADEE